MDKCPSSGHLIWCGNAVFFTFTNAFPGNALNKVIDQIGGWAGLELAQNTRQASRGMTLPVGVREFPYGPSYCSLLLAASRRRPEAACLWHFP